MWQRLRQGTELLAAGMLFGMMVLTVMDVIGRYFLNAPLAGAFELTRLAMGLLVFSALPIVSARENHIMVELFVPLFTRSPRQKVVQRGVVALASMVIMGFIAWRVWEQAANMLRNGDKTPSLSLPLYPVVFYMALLGFATTIALAAVWLSYLRTGTNVYRTGTFTAVE